MPSLFGISIEREAGDAGETFWLVNNAPTEPIKYRFIENSKSLARFQEMMSVDDLAVLLNVIGDEEIPLLEDATTGQAISGAEEAMTFWTDNLANAKRIDAVGFEVVGEAFEIAEDVMLEDMLGEAAAWLLVFL